MQRWLEGRFLDEGGFCVGAALPLNLDINTHSLDGRYWVKCRRKNLGMIEAEVTHRTQLCFRKGVFEEPKI